MKNPPKWRSKQSCNQDDFFSSVRQSKVQKSLCEEPELCKLQEKKRERNSSTDCMRSQSCLLQNVNHRIANSEGFPSKIEKLSEGEQTNPRQSSSEGEAFFLSWVRRATKFFWRLTYSGEEKKTETEKKGVTVRPQTWPSSKTRLAMYWSQEGIIIPG